MTGPGWVYVLTHPAWDKLGMVKVGRTGRDPRTHAAEITSVSGLLAPATVAWCSPVSDMVATEQAVHRMLGSHRVRKRRELFRVDAATARGVIEAVAGSLPTSGPLLRPSPRSVPAQPASFGGPAHALPDLALGIMAGATSWCWSASRPASRRSSPGSPWSNRIWNAAGCFEDGSTEEIREARAKVRECERLS